MNHLEVLVQEHRFYRFLVLPSEHRIHPECAAFLSVNAEGGFRLWEQYRYDWTELAFGREGQGSWIRDDSELMIHEHASLTGCHMNASISYTYVRNPCNVTFADSI